jgi:hypothetical protein
VRFEELEPADRATLLFGRAEIDGVRGRPVEPFLEEMATFAAGTDDPTMKGAVAGSTGFVRLTQGRYEEAYLSGMATADDPLNAPLGLAWATRAAVRLRDRDRRRAMDRFEAVGARAFSSSTGALRAAVAALEGRWPEAAAGFREAWSRYRDLGIETALAMSQLDCLAVAPAADPLAEEAKGQRRAHPRATGGGPTPRPARRARRGAQPGRQPSRTPAATPDAPLVAREATR